MVATILDGRVLAKIKLDALLPDIAIVSRALHRPLGLGVLLVGDNPASLVYVHRKELAAQRLGIMTRVVRLPADTTYATIATAVQQLNQADNIDAILVQLPLPASIDAHAIINLIDPKKDADGLHPLNMGRLLLGLSGMQPCTPSGVMALLHNTGRELRGLKAVVLGRSMIVGRPLAVLLQQSDATVTLCHSQTIDIAQEIREADIVVAAIGKPAAIDGHWIKPGAIVIDVGINRLNGQLIGDVQYPQAAARAAFITPVPGGVGPMTVAMLMHNVLMGAKNRL